MMISTRNSHFYAISYNAHYFANVSSVMSNGTDAGLTVVATTPQITSIESVDGLPFIDTGLITDITEGAIDGEAKMAGQ